jgi:hypothetical protein
MRDPVSTPKMELTNEEENVRARKRAADTLATDGVERRRDLSTTDRLVRRPHGKGIGVEVKHSRLSSAVDLTRLTVDAKGYLVEVEEHNPRWKEILDGCVLVARPGLNQIWPLYYPKALSTSSEQVG